MSKFMLKTNVINLQANICSWASNKAETPYQNYFLELGIHNSRDLRELSIPSPFGIDTAIA